MNYSPNTWNQLKNTTADELVKALKKDGWERDEERAGGAILAFRKSSERITIHYHPKKTYGPKLLKGLLDKIGWSEKDLQRLKLIKK